MGMTLTEKLVCAHADLDRVEPGMEVSVSVDRVFMGEEDFSCLRKARLDPAAWKGNRCVVAAMDQSIEARDAAGIERMKEIRARFQGPGGHFFYPLGRGGIGSVLFADGGHVRPGDLVVAANSQCQAFGALGALSLVLEEEERLATLESGRLTLQVPETLRLVFRGTPGKWTRGKDLALYAFKLLGSDSLKGRAVELAGEAVRNLDLPDRLSMASFARNLGARNVVIQPDEKTRVFARSRSDRPFFPQHNDKDAVFADLIEIDVEGLPAQVLVPSHEEKVLSASRARDLKVAQVIIGTGGNGRIEDIRAAAALLREHKTRNFIRLILIPGSQQICLHAMEEGLIQIFLRAGAHLGLPSEYYADRCHVSGVGTNERIITSSDSLHTDSPAREVVVANPMVAAASAVVGYVVDPFEMLRTVKRASTGLTG